METNLEVHIDFFFLSPHKFNFEVVVVADLNLNISACYGILKLDLYKL